MGQTAAGEQQPQRRDDILRDFPPVSGIQLVDPVSEGNLLGLVVDDSLPGQQVHNLFQDIPDLVERGRPVLLFVGEDIQELLLHLFPQILLRAKGKQAGVLLADPECLRLGFGNPFADGRDPFLPRIVIGFLVDDAFKSLQIISIVLVQKQVSIAGIDPARERHPIRFPQTGELPHKQGQSGKRLPILVERLSRLGKLGIDDEGIDEPGVLLEIVDRLLGVREGDDLDSIPFKEGTAVFEQGLDVVIRPDHVIQVLHRNNLVLSCVRQDPIPG